MYLYKKLQPTDKVTIIYLAISLFFITANTIIKTHDQQALLQAIIIRAIIICSIITLIILNLKFNNWIFKIGRNTYPFLFITYLYAETRFAKNIFFNDLDPYCVAIDKIIFGTNPSIDLYRSLNLPFITELLTFGYLTYFIIIPLVPVVVYYTRKNLAKKCLFIITSSFYLYYIIYCVIPVIGPQFFYSFPYNYISNEGFAPHMLSTLQKIEYPTGAFPSSHVGITMILLIFCYKYKIKLFYLLIPILMIIIVATVYIKAHYAIDAIAGFISSFIIYTISYKLYDKFSQVI